VQLVDITHADVQTWITRLAQTRSPATVRKIHRVFSLVLKTAVKDGRLGRNAADGVNLPRVAMTERRYLTHAQVRLLAEECGRHRLVVLFLAYTGRRFGEMAALRVGRLDLLRRRAIVAESVTLVRGVQTWGTPKGHERREVPIPRFLVDELATQVAGKQRDELVFTGEKGGALRAQVFQRSVLSAAAERLDLNGLHPHELRHPAASLAIASGATIKVVQQMLVTSRPPGRSTCTATSRPTSLTSSGTGCTTPRQPPGRARADFLRTFCGLTCFDLEPKILLTRRTPRIPGGRRV
jgi:integrase